MGIIGNNLKFQQKRRVMKQEAVVGNLNHAG